MWCVSAEPSAHTLNMHCPVGKQQILTYTGLGSKYHHLFREVDEMETHAPRTGAGCKVPAKELKQQTAIPESTAQGRKAIPGSTKRL